MEKIEKFLINLIPIKSVRKKLRIKLKNNKYYFIPNSFLSNDGIFHDNFTPLENVNFGIRKKDYILNLPTEEYINHCPTEICNFLKPIKEIKIAKDYNFMDVGSGTGYVMWIASNIFKNVSGIEFDKFLYNLSLKNLENVNIKNYKVFNEDVLKMDYKLLNNINVFFLYNPFVGSIMEKFILDLDKSIAENNRKVYVIYVNNVCHDLFLTNSKKLKLFKLLENKNWRDTAIYSN